MKNVYIARQPIFDRNREIYGYELLYRSTKENRFIAMDDDLATSELIYNSFFVFGLDELTEGTNAFINFSKTFIDSDVPELLPKDNIVIEILEREQVSSSTIDACKRMKELGYRIALDDFVFDEAFLPMIVLADIIKIEYEQIKELPNITFLRKMHKKAKFLAEKIETQEEYETAYEMGFDYFQGFFFQKPLMQQAQEIDTLNANMFDILEELSKDEPDYARLAKIVESDLGLSYKLLKLVNSAYFATRNKIQSIQQALAYLGTNALYQWVSMILLKDLSTMDNRELIKTTLIRAKTMDLLAEHLGSNVGNSDYFFTGMFSSIDVLLGVPMKQALVGLPLSDDVKNALLGEDNECGKMLRFVIAYENADWECVQDVYDEDRIDGTRFMQIYLKALQWAGKLNY